MKTPQILILAHNEFHRRLMADVVRCNEMRALATDKVEWVDRVTSGAYEPNVVVVDCDLPGRQGVRVIEKLSAMTSDERPRIIAMVPDGKELRGTNGRAFQLEGYVKTPLDVGEFARTVSRQAREAVIAASG